MAKIDWNTNGWTTVQEADPDRHVLEISCRCEDGQVVEVRFRHNDGEEQVAKVLCDGENVLPMPCKEFQKMYKKGKIDLK